MLLWTNDGRSVFGNVALLNFLVHDVKHIIKTPEQKASKNIFTSFGLILRFCIIRVKYHSEIKVTSV